MYTLIIFCAIGVLVLFRILSFLRRKIPFSTETKHYTSFILPMIEIIVWICLVIWAVKISYEIKSFTSIVVFALFIVILVIPSWSLIKDFLLGIVLQVQRKIEIGSRIEINGISGVVIKTDYFSFEVKRGNGNVDIIPYNRVRSEIISKSAANFHLEKQVIHFTFDDIDINQLKTELNTAIINAPWGVSTQDAVINEIKKEAGKILVNVIVYIIKKEHSDKIRDYVITNMSKLNIV